MSKSSYRKILLSSSIVGGAQVINIAAGILRMKVVAEVLGPTGVGLVGLYMSLIQTASSIAALGLGSVGTRQIAEAYAEGGDIAVGRTRRALFWGTLVLALVGAALFWLLSGWIARVTLADESRANDVAWLSLGVALTVAAGSQGALLTGLRRIGDLARISVGSGVIGTVLGALVLWFWGAQGLIAMVLVAPLLSFLLGHLYVARLGSPAGLPSRLPEMLREWHAMVALGLAFMLGGLVTTVGHLVARSLVQRELGAEALGHFQAAWGIGITYLGFVLGAMATDYYPRLTAVIRDNATATRLVNEQTEVALLLCAPVLLAMFGLAPWVIQLLYTAEFAPAVEILRWQILGDILKVMSWPLGFVILASGKGKTFILTEMLGMGAFLLGVLFGLPLIGITATGVAFLALYVVYLPLMWLLSKRSIDFRWTRAVKFQALGVIAAVLALDVVARWDQWMGAASAIVLACMTGLWAVLRLSAMTEAEGRLSAAARAGDRIVEWMKKQK